MNVYAVFHLLAKVAIYAGGLVALLCLVALWRDGTWTTPSVRRCLAAILFLLPAFGLFRLLSAPLDSQNSLEVLLLVVLVLAGLYAGTRDRFRQVPGRENGKQAPI